MKNYIHWFGKVVRPHCGAVAVMMGCHVLLAACSVCFVYVSKQLVDIAVDVFKGTSAREMMYPWIGMMVGVIICRILLNALRTYFQTRTEIKIKNSQRRRLFDILLRMDMEAGKRHHSGDILNRIQEDVRVVSSTLAGHIPNLFGTLLQFVAALVFLLYLDLRLAVVIVVIVPVGLLVGRFITGRIRSLTLDIRNRDSKVQSHLQESIQHLTLLQTLEYEHASSGELDDLQGELYSSEMRRTKFSIVSRIFVGLAFQAGYATAFMWGVLGISSGTVTYGMMTAFLQLVGQIQRPLLDMSSQLPAIIHSTASVDRIMEIESLPQEDADEPEFVSGTAGVLVENVTFAYPDSDIPVLENFSHDFTPGSRTAIVGPTGVGKSTLIRLLLALLKPQSGSIHIYGDSVLQASGACSHASAPGALMGQSADGGDSVLQASGACPHASAPGALMGQSADGSDSVLQASGACPHISASGALMGQSADGGDSVLPESGACPHISASGALMGQSADGGDSVLQASGACPHISAPRAAGQNRRQLHNATSATRCNLIYVPQGNSLFSGTVRDNLYMGNPEATEHQMKEALHIAAADFVLDHPDGLDMPCFESGGGLSEGQAQRIAIARALLRPGTILLLDEFSSALDAETEITLMERLTTNLPNHTMIFITHRDKIIDYCTAVLKL